jgi:hypothetical protein
MQQLGHIRSGEKLVTLYSTPSERLPLIQSVRVDAFLQPAGQNRCEFRGINAAEVAGECGQSRGFATTEVKGMRNGRAVLPTEPRDAGEACAASKHGGGHKLEKVGNERELTMSAASISYRGESFDDRDGRKGIPSRIG